jgi:hypothetical protein
VEDEAVSARLGVPPPQSGQQLDPAGQTIDPAAVGGDNAQIIIDLDIISGMTESACEHYKGCIFKFAGALAREASRLEEADRAEDIDIPEITATMVVKANDLIRHPPVERTQTSIPILIAQALAFAAAMLTPIFGSNLHSKWQWTVTILCGILATASEVFAIIAVRRR